MPGSNRPTSDIAPFGAAVTFVIDRIEGGDKRVVDQGGVTRWGISKKAHPDVDIENLDRPGAERIYRDEYWDVVRASELPPALALLVFDASVNHGPELAAKLLQRVLNLHDDGVVGPKTIAAARTFSPSELRARFNEIRLRWYEDLAAKYPRHRPSLYGWRLRMFRIADEAGRWGDVPAQDQEGRR